MQAETIIKFTGYLLCLLIASATSVFGETVRFHAEGEIVSSAKFSLPKGASSNTVTRFQVDFDSCNWRIRTERKAAKYDFRFDVGTSGSDIFSVTYLRSETLTNWVPSASSARPGPIPFVLGDPMIQLLWVAFVSQCHFPSDGPQLQPKIFFPYSPDLNNANFKLPMDVKRNNASPFFLSSLTMFMDGSWRSWEEPHDAWVRPPSMKPLPPPYENGYTNYMYQVRNFEITGNITYPQRFSFTSYQMRQNASASSDLDVVSTLEGQVSRFEMKSETVSLIPEIPTGLPLAEERFIWDEQPVFSFLHQSVGRWLPKNEVKKLPAYEKQLRRQQSQKKFIESRPAGLNQSSSTATTNTKKRLVLGFMVVATLIPIFFIRRKHLAKKNHQKQKERKLL